MSKSNEVILEGTKVNISEYIPGEDQTSEKIVILTEDLDISGMEYVDDNTFLDIEAGNEGEDVYYTIIK